MTFKEFGMLADAIKTYFPRDNILPTNEAMELWYDMLKDLDYKSACIGLKKHVASSRFAPTIADIRENVVSINEPQELNEMEAWALVYKAMCNSGYNSVEEFAKLPPLLQKAVGLPDNLREWALTENLNLEVVSSNFMRNYKAVILREKEFAKMPSEVKAIIQNAAQETYSAQIAAEREETIKLSSEREKGEIKALEAKSDSVPMPQRLKKRLEDWKK